MLNKLRKLYRYVHPRYQTVFLDYQVDPRPRFGHGHPAHPLLLDIIRRHQDDYAHLLRIMLSYREQLWTIRTAEAEKDETQPTWNNGFLPGLDIAAIYGIIAHFKPRRYMEVGSGNSTKVVHKARLDGNLDTRITSVDPHPRADIDALADVVLRQALEHTDLTVFDQLQDGDVLFIDNSHRILPNSDCTVFFTELLPRLRTGVIVHIHDIYIPYDYPPFMCERFYSEQYGLACFLLANAERYRPMLPAYYVSEDPALAALLSPLWQHPHMEQVERHGGSFWLRIH
jgi:hypothetical protein